MTTSTPKLGIIKADPTDTVDYEAHIGDGFDRVDEDLPNRVCTSGTRPSTPYNGMMIYETDTRNLMMYDTAAGEWQFPTASFANAAARDTAVPSPDPMREGMISYLKDVDTYQTFDGTNWVDLLTPGVWRAYTPVLTALTTNPTLGTGSTQAGRYCCVGNLIVAQGIIAFGTTGANAGSSTYEISVPFPIVMFGGTTSPIGLVEIVDSSASAHALLPAVVATDGDAKFRVRYPVTYPTGTLANMNHSTPWAWAASDSIQFSVAYEVKV